MRPKLSKVLKPILMNFLELNVESNTQSITEIDFGFWFAQNYRTTDESLAAWRVDMGRGL